jgi:hypothetical protein
MDHAVVQPRSTRRLILLSVAGAVILLLGVFLFPSIRRWMRAEKAIDATSLRFASVERGDLLRDVSVQGRVVASLHPTLFSPGQGIVSLRTRAGSQVRTGDRAGWAHASELTDAAGKKAQDENVLQPKFRVMPLPVSAPGAHGEIYFEANVNTDGDVTDVKLITNTTGSEALANQNAAALRSAKFYPIIQKNTRKPFKYYRKVTY